MSLLSMAAEVKLMITSYLDPISDYQLAITCKTLWEFCDELIQKHKRLTTKYQRIDAGNAGTLLWTTLREILDDPSKGWYVRELNLPYDRQTFWDPKCMGDAVLIDGEYNPVPDELADVFAAAARKLDDHYPITLEDLNDDSDENIIEADAAYMDTKNLVSNITEAMKKGHEEAIICILVHYLPMLRVLRVTNTSTSNGCLLFTLLMQVAIGYGNATFAPLMPFQHLETVSVNHYGGRGGGDGCDWEWTLYLNCIPSVQTSAAQAMTDCSPTYRCHGDKLPTNSNVKELFFTNSQLRNTSLREIFMGIKGLEKFTYEGGYVSEGGNYNYTARRVIKDLAEYQGHSLQELFLEFDNLHTECEYEDLDCVSLRPFQKLKKLRCDWRMLHLSGYRLHKYRTPGYPSDEEDDLKGQPDFHIKNILPESLEILHLSGPFKGEQWDRLKDQLDLDELKKELPNLMDIYLEKDYQEVQH